MKSGQPVDRSRRDFARIFAVGGSAALFAARPAAWTLDGWVPAQGPPDEGSWQRVRGQFVMPPGFTCLNAANLCPSPVRVLDGRFGRDAFGRPRSILAEPPEDPRRPRSRAAAAGRHTARDPRRDRHHAQYQRVEQLRLERTRLQARRRSPRLLGQPPEQLAAWRQKAERFGFTVTVVEQVNPHPGAEYYVDAFREQITRATKGGRR